MEEFKIVLSEKDKKICRETQSSDDILDIGYRIFNEQILQYIANNPGLVQSSLKKTIPVEFESGIYSSWLCIIHCLSELKLIKRKKKGFSFELYVTGDLEKIKEYISSPDKLQKKMDSVDKKIAQSQTYILASRYENWDKIIIDHFGENTIKKLFSSIWKVTYKHLSLGNTTDEFIENCKIEAYERFLTDLGGGIRFEVNKELQDIIDKYFPKGFESKLGKFTTPSEFMVDNFQGLAMELLESDNYKDLVREIRINASKLEIKWCGCWGELRISSFPEFYLQSLAYKKSLQLKVKKPGAFIKKCKYCGKEFCPSYDFRYIKKSISENYPHLKSIDEINFCPEHAIPKDEPTISKEKMIYLLKKLIEIIGFIPPSTFKENLSYLSGFDDERFDEAITTLNKMPHYDYKMSYYDHFESPHGYKQIFGSWFKALIATGVLKEDARKMSRGYMCLAKDGHECLSLAEKNIDDWMYAHGIKHEKEPMYPGEGKFRGDWKVGEYYIEYWGLKGQEDYDNKILLKREIAKEHNIKLIEISYNDINNLKEKLDVLLKKEKK